jgi:hypothetical protein
MQGEEDLCLEFDFFDQKIFYVCPQCKKENEMNFQTWQKQQEASPLPRMSTSRF